MKTRYAQTSRVLFFVLHGNKLDQHGDDLSMR